MNPAEKQAPEGYRKIITPSAVPFYLAAGIWVLAAFTLPMHRIWALAVTALVSALAYFLGKRFFPGKVRYEQKQPDPDDPKEMLIFQGRKSLFLIRKYREKLLDQQMAEKTDRLLLLGEKILTLLSEEKGDLPGARRFLRYYLPETEKLLAAYYKAESQQISGENIDEVKKKIRDAVDAITDAFQRQLDRLFSDDAVEVSADIAVLQMLLKQEGLWESPKFGPENRTENKD